MRELTQLISRGRARLFPLIYAAVEESTSSENEAPTRVVMSVGPLFISFQRFCEVCQALLAAEPDAYSLREEAPPGGGAKEI